MSAEYPRVSIIAPAYNAELYLADFIESVKSQSFTGWELIIADDGSTDNTFAVADYYARSDSRIKVIRLPHIGVSGTRNSCIDIAKGKYISFADGDDLLEPDYLKELVSRADNYNADIVQCSFCFLESSGEKIPDKGGSDFICSDRNSIITAYFRGQLGDIRISAWAKLFRREKFTDIHFNPGIRVYEDAFYVYECCKKAETVVSFSNPLYLYRQHEDSTMHTLLATIYPDYFKVFDLQREDFSNDPSVMRRIRRREAEYALWLMNYAYQNDDPSGLWKLRKIAVKDTVYVLFSSSPFLMKIKLAGVTLMPHIYFAILKRRAGSDNEKI